MARATDRIRILEAADQTTAIYYQRYLSNKGACFLTDGIPRAINVTALPCPVSRAAYTHLHRAQLPLNKLIDLASRDTDFVVSAVEPSTKVDNYARELLQIYKGCQGDTRQGDARQITLGMYRHDYMFHTADPTAEEAVREGEFKMVEANLMSAALLGTGLHVMELHNQVLAKEMPSYGMPYNKTLMPMMEGVSAAYKLYNRPGSVFLFLVAPDDFNWFDQQKMIDCLWDEHGVLSLKMTFDEFMNEGELREERYYVRGKEVAVFYFRSMFNEEHYTSSAHWDMRLHMERSLAVKVPNIRHQVMNLKLFQEAFLRPGSVEKYLSAEESVLVRTLFAELHQLAPGPEGDTAAKLALDNPAAWVLKPSREGGGNNYWKEEMVEKLTELADSPAREAFVLMQRLTPPRVPNRFIRNTPGAPPTISEIFDTNTELGMFNVYVTDGEGKVVRNVCAGPQAKAKPADSCEGGIAIGIGVMDSVAYVD